MEGQKDIVKMDGRMEAQMDRRKYRYTDTPKDECEEGKIIEGWTEKAGETEIR